VLETVLSSTEIPSVEIALASGRTIAQIDLPKEFVFGAVWGRLARKLEDAAGLGNLIRELTTEPLREIVENLPFGAREAFVSELRRGLSGKWAAKREEAGSWATFVAALFDIDGLSEVASSKIPLSSDAEFAVSALRRLAAYDDGEQIGARLSVG